MFKKLMAGVLLATLAVTAFASVASAAPTKDIVAKAIAVNARTGQFDTVLTAATCGYFGGAVVDILTSPDKTLFAPTDLAFKKLGQALGLGKAGLNPSNVCSVDSLLGDGTLLTILGYHVIDGRVAYRDAVAAIGTKVPMLLGGKAKITGTPAHLRIDGALIIVKNVRATNGFIHVVNKVLLPPAIG
jgi:transforming growth factor-beta-induced protein